MNQDIKSSGHAVAIKMDFAEQVTVRGAGAKSRLDFVIDSGSSLSAVEVKTPVSGRLALQRQQAQAGVEQARAVK